MAAGGSRDAACVAVMKLLISRGADIHAETIVGRSVDVMPLQGRTALHLAAMHERGAQVVQLLVSKGADVNAKSKEVGGPALWPASTAPWRLHHGNEHAKKVIGNVVILPDTALLDYTYSICLIVPALCWNFLCFWDLEVARELGQCQGPQFGRLC